jgi:hypothetical protein
MNTEFQYIKAHYGVKADLHREVIVNGNRGVITSDMGNYIGVNFYDNPTHDPLPCHPTWEVEYLDSFNYKPPIKKRSQSANRYRHFKSLDLDISFGEFLKLKLYRR